MKMLKQKTSGELYVWTEILAQRDDMEDYIAVPSEPVQTEKVDEDIKTLAKAVLVKKPGRKPNVKEASLGNKES